MVRLMWLPLNRHALRLCWCVHLTSLAQRDGFEVLIDVESGQALRKRSMSSSVGDASYLVFASDSPSPLSPGHSAPSSVQPPLVSRTLVPESSVRSDVGSPNGWIYDGINETRGNNVDAFLDRNADNVADSRPQGNPTRVFQPTLDLGLEPAAYPSASVVQLFYWCNWMHDRLYDLGFTRAARNFEGANDYLIAQAQFGADLAAGNNNRFLFYPNGQHSRLWTYLWTNPTPDRDSSLDAEIVLHEYTHGLVGRSVGGGVGPSTEENYNQYRGLDEGWADFYPIALLSSVGDQVNGNFAIGAYTTFLHSAGFTNYYFGARRYPYSRDLSKNPLTFKDINPRLANGHTNVPLADAWVGVDPGFLANFSHRKGEVWCATLWDARGMLVEKHGHATGTQLILQLVTDGMRCLPADTTHWLHPTFLEARNAILNADVVNNGGANTKELWTAFYKRGMGAAAVDLSTITDKSEVLEAFNRADFNLDGRPDIVLEHPGTDVKVWTMNGAARLGELWLSPSSLGGTWVVVGTADINRDGKVDLFLQDSGLNVAYCYLNETSVVSQGALDPSHPGGSWRIVGTGDFNGDTRQDLLWQYADGYLVVWYMNGPNLVSAAWLSPYDPGDYRWKVVGTGDFNRDGKVDILFQYFNPGGASDGALVVWYMNGVSLVSAVPLNPLYPSGPEWRVAGTEDFNSDGDVDILFQLKLSPNGGDLGIWFMDGVNLTSATLTTPTNPGTDWNAVGPR